MMELPPVIILMSTYFPSGEMGRIRRDAAIETLYTWDDYLYYGGDFHLHIADDGSEHDHYLGDNGTWEGISYSSQLRQGLGASLNAGLFYTRNISPLVFMAMDDWSLTSGYDLTPWAELLMTREDIGMVRLGPPHPNLRGTIEHLGELGWGLKLEKYSYAYGQRPALYHRRFFETYGALQENKSAIDCEREYSERVNSMEGPAIMLALPHPWQHIYTTSLSDLTP